MHTHTKHTKTYANKDKHTDAQETLHARTQTHAMLTLTHTYTQKLIHKYTHTHTHRQAAEKTKHCVKLQ